jgi:hypothetical protein
LRNRILLITSLLTLATLASAQNFVAPRIFNLGNVYLTQVAVGDFNGDGKPDVVFPNYNTSSQVEVSLNNGNGTFKAPVVTNVAGTGLIGIAVGDFNGDGKLDVVVGQYPDKNGFGAVRIMLGNGDGTFQAGKTISVATTPSVIVVGDFNNDGKLDVALSLLNATPDVNVLLGNGDGTLQAPTTLSLGGSATSFATGDFNGDGKLDLIVATASNENVTVALGNGDGTFQAGKTTFLGVGISGVALGDLNHDGHLDLVTFIPFQTGTNTYVSLGNGDGTFQSVKSFAGASQIDSVTLADVNHDGNLDLVIANRVSPALNVLLGNGDGTFQTGVGFYVSGGLQQLLVADFNGDGNLDIAGTNYQAPSLTVTFGKGDGTFLEAPAYSVGGPPGTGLSADFNNDGIPDLAFASGAAGAAVLLGNGDGTFQKGNGSGTGQSLAAGDFNHDGKIDVASVPSGEEFLTVALGNGNGTFGLGTDFNADARPDFVATGDVNGDGILDLVGSNYDSNDISVLLGNGDGTFGTATDTPVGQIAPGPLVLADFNGDHKLDLVVASIGIGGVRGGLTVMLGNGDGTLGPPLLYAKDDFQAVTVADMNGDGKLDLIAFGSDPATKGTFITVSLGNGDGTFQKAITNTTTASYYSLIVADFNGDGIMDVAGGEYGGAIDIYLGKGNGTLQAPVSFAAGGYPAYLIGGDFNADGAPDIAAGNYLDSTASILLNTAGSFITTTSSPNPSAVGQSVTFTATVKGSINTTTTPTGSVTFYDGNTSLGKVTMTAGSASLSTSTLTTGSHTITASYSGDTNFFAHTGAPITQSVQSGPLVTLSPTSLTFASQTVGTVSPPQTIILSNSGVSTLIINSIVASGDYAVTSTCSASIAAGKKCSITVTFAPTAAGTRTGTVSITDNAPGSPQIVSLTGTGVAPIVTLSPASLTFATQLVSSTSPPQTVTLSNTGTAVLSISKITITGSDTNDYLESNNCGSTVSAGSSCTISVVFKPKARGSRPAALNVFDNATGSPQNVTLSGTGTVVSLSASSINFGTETVGKTSAPNTLTLTNTAQTTLSIQSITITGANPGDFAQTNTCGSAVAGGATCTVSVTFTPAKKGSRSALLSIADSGGGSPQTVSLTGTGQ